MFTLYSASRNSINSVNCVNGGSNANNFNGVNSVDNSDNSEQALFSAMLPPSLIVYFCSGMEMSTLAIHVGAI